MPYYKLPNNTFFFIDPTDNLPEIEKKYFSEGTVKITEAEAMKIRDAEIAARENKKTYAEKRAGEYPSIANQLDLLYHGGFDAWKAAIKTVKDKYPKI